MERVFSFFPLKTRFQMVCVCKRWREPAMAIEDLDVSDLPEMDALGDDTTRAHAFVDRYIAPMARTLRVVMCKAAIDAPRWRFAAERILETCPHVKGMWISADADTAHALSVHPKLFVTCVLRTAHECHGAISRIGPRARYAVQCDDLDVATLTTVLKCGTTQCVSIATLLGDASGCTSNLEHVIAACDETLVSFEITNVEYASVSQTIWRALEKCPHVSYVCVDHAPSVTTRLPATVDSVQLKLRPEDDADAIRAAFRDVRLREMNVACDKGTDVFTRAFCDSGAIRELHMLHYANTRLTPMHRMPSVIASCAMLHALRVDVHEPDQEREVGALFHAVRKHATLRTLSVNAPGVHAKSAHVWQPFLDMLQRSTLMCVHCIVDAGAPDGVRMEDVRDVQDAIRLSTRVERVELTNAGRSPRWFAQIDDDEDGTVCAIVDEDEQCVLFERAVASHYV